jgi:hypothetical protein
MDMVMVRIDFLNHYCEQHGNLPVGAEWISDNHHYDDFYYYRYRSPRDIGKIQGWSYPYDQK